jgi:hypothetical protein
MLQIAIEKRFDVGGIERASHLRGRVGDNTLGRMHFCGLGDAVWHVT